MNYPPLFSALLLRRYKRFFVDVEQADGNVITAHCPNTGSMRGLLNPGSPVWLSTSDNPCRKLAHTLEIIDAGGALVAVNTLRANDLVASCLKDFSAPGGLPELAGLLLLRREVRFGPVRFDFALTSPAASLPVFMEVKSVTLAEQQTALFPDARSERGRHHLEQLMAARRLGHRAILFYAVLRGDVTSVAPADAIDPAYGETFRAALAAGVEVVAYRFSVTPEALLPEKSIPVHGTYADALSN
jgi:sugar fermentation stimulation protein A